jgi:hypothetical protein
MAASTDNRPVRRGLRRVRMDEHCALSCAATEDDQLGNSLPRQNADQLGSMRWRVQQGRGRTWRKAAYVFGAIKG